MTRRPRMLNEPKESAAPYVVFAVVVALLLVVLIVNLLRVTYTFAVGVSGSSMEDTIHGGDIVYALPSFDAERGDIVIIDVQGDPGFDPNTENIIKRLIAKEGDCVKCEDGVVYVKPAGGEYAPLDEPYTKGVTPDFPEVAVGEGEIFFLGDHRDVSRDSTEVGTRLYSDIIGVVPDWAVSIKWLTTPVEKFRCALQDLLENFRYALQDLFS